MPSPPSPTPKEVIDIDEGKYQPQTDLIDIDEGVPPLEWRDIPTPNQKSQYRYLIDIDEGVPPLGWGDIPTPNQKSQYRWGVPK